MRYADQENDSQRDKRFFHDQFRSPEIGRKLNAKFVILPTLWLPRVPNTSIFAKLPSGNFPVVKSTQPSTCRQGEAYQRVSGVFVEEQKPYHDHDFAELTSTIYRGKCPCGILVRIQITNNYLDFLDRHVLCAAQKKVCRIEY